MSNLFKFSTIVCDNDKKVVDSNALISEKLVKIRESMNKSDVSSDGSGFTLGLKAERVEVLIDDNDEEQEYSEADIAEINEKASAVLDDAYKRAEQIIADAKAQADRILSDSKKKSADILEQAKEDGMSQARELARLQTEELEINLAKEYEEKCRKLDAEYDERIKKMEPELVDILLKIFSEVTGVLAKDKKDMILTLVDTVMSGTDVSKNYIIKTSKEDAQFLRDNKERIHGTVGRDINVEIVEDPTLKRNQCLIDTDIGIFDCSLDIQLEKLIDAIKIIACSSVDYFN